MRAAILVAAWVLSGCGHDGEGTIALRISGEEAAVEGLPTDAGEAPFADGWSVEFDAYLVAIADVEIAAADDGGTASDVVYIADLHLGDRELDALGPVAARRWDRVSWTVRPPEQDDEIVADGVAQADVDAMIAGDFDILVRGRATDGTRELTFEWGLENPSHNRDCTNGVDGTAGLVVRNNTVTDAEITVHVEHMFWDTLGSETNELRFAPIAAMADADGVIAFAALADQSLSDMRGPDGEPLLEEDGAALVYNPGSLAISNLQEFVLAATRTQAHFGGEGLCTIEPL